MTRPPEPLVELGAELGVDGEPLFARRAAEEIVVQTMDAPQLDERVGMVVDAQVDEAVGEPGVAAVPLDDEKRRGLAPAAVATRRLCGVEAVEQPFGAIGPAKP